MKRCRICVLPESFPGLTFNSKGVCSICQEQHGKNVRAAPSKQNLRRKFESIIAKYKGRHEYDALVAFSGGKDSTYLLHKLKKKYDLSILAFTLDNGFIPKHAFVNMRRVTEKLNIDLQIFKLRNDLAKDIFLHSAYENIYPNTTATLEYLIL